MAPTTAWLPQPGGVSRDELGDEHAEDQREHPEARTAVEPLELLAVLPARVPVGRYLDGQPGRPADQGPDDHHHAEDTKRSGQRVGQVAVGLDADVTPGGDQHAPARGGQAGQQPADRGDRGGPVPPARRQRPVGEQPQQQRDEDQEHRPAFLEHHRQPAQRQRPVMRPVVQVEVWGGGADLQDDDGQQHPADRVARPASGEQHPHRGRGHRADRRQERVGRPSAGPGLVREVVQQDGGHAEPDRDHAEHDGRRSCRPRSPARTHRHARLSRGRPPMTQP